MKPYHDTDRGPVAPIDDRPDHPWREHCCDDPPEWHPPQITTRTTSDGRHYAMASAYVTSALHDSPGAARLALLRDLGWTG